MSNIKSLKVGDRFRIKDSCTKYEQKYNGKIGVVISVSLRLDDTEDIPLVIDGHRNPRATSGCFYFRECDLEIITEVNIKPDVATNYREYDWNLYESCSNTFDNKGEKEMKSEKIINLWRENQGKVIGNAINKKENEILNLDPIYSSIKIHVEEIDKILSEQNFNKVSDEIQFKAYKLKTTDALLLQNRAFGSKLQKDLDMQYIEIYAMLSACDTYEQEMEVLKTYNIVGEDGKLVVVH